MKEHTIFLPSTRYTPVGLLVLAHGGSDEWEEQVVEKMRSFNSTLPVAIAFGMAMNSSEYIREGILKLEKTGVREIAVLPLFVSSYAPVPRQMEYIFQRRKKPVFSTVSQISTRLRIHYLSAVDGDYQIGRIIADFTDELSERPEEEVVLLVAHGPITEADNQIWLNQLRRMGEEIQGRGYVAIEVATLRDDAPPEIRNRAVEDIRRLIHRWSPTHRVLVVPVLISSSDIQQKILKILPDCPCRFSHRGIISHPEITKYIRKKITPYLLSTYP